MKVNNPYLARKRELLRLIDREPSEALRQEFEEVEYKNREWNNERLAELTEGVEKAEPKVHQIRKSDDSDVKQYRAMCALYRRADKLIHDIRTAKRELREEIENRRERERK